MRSSEIVKKFNNKIIVIDEAHNLRLSDVKVNYEKIDVYGEVHRFIHLLTNKKVLLLTGTPYERWSSRNSFINEFNSSSNSADAHQ